MQSEPGTATRPCPLWPENRRPARSHLRYRPVKRIKTRPQTTTYGKVSFTRGSTSQDETRVVFYANTVFRRPPQLLNRQEFKALEHFGCKPRNRAAFGVVVISLSPLCLLGFQEDAARSAGLIHPKHIAHGCFVRRNELPRSRIVDINENQSLVLTPAPCGGYCTKRSTLNME
jgi:hypothetical protein